MQRTTALVISAAIVIAVVAYVLFRYFSQRGRSKYGFAARQGDDANLSRAELAKRVFEAFVAQNDAAIKDVFSVPPHIQVGRASRTRAVNGR